MASQERQGEEDEEEEEEEKEGKTSRAPVLVRWWIRAV